MVVSVSVSVVLVIWVKVEVVVVVMVLVEVTMVVVTGETVEKMVEVEVVKIVLVLVNVLVRDTVTDEVLVRIKVAVVVLRTVSTCHSVRVTSFCVVEVITVGGPLQQLDMVHPAGQHSPVLVGSFRLHRISNMAKFPSLYRQCPKCSHVNPIWKLYTISPRVNIPISSTRTAPLGWIWVLCSWMVSGRPFWKSCSMDFPHWWVFRQHWLSPQSRFME